MINKGAKRCLRLSQWNLDWVDDDDFYPVDDMRAGETCSAWSCHFTSKISSKNTNFIAF